MRTSRITGRSRAFALAIVLAANFELSAADLKFDITPAEWELRPGLTTSVWSYGGTVPGTPIVVRPGERVRVAVTNRLPQSTNIHWHGLVLPNDQDGPFINIEPGATFNYDFIAGESGTYWYHPHWMPVLPQLDRGLYAPFIVLAPEDSRYSGDHVYVLDDWLLDGRGRRLEGTAPGAMERYGNVETVNGKTGEAIAPLKLRAGELHKLRFINASTAAVHTLTVTGHSFRVTHLDGHPLIRPYLTDVISLAPAERVDVELFASGKEGDRFEISSDRRGIGIAIPILYGPGSVTRLASPFQPPAEGDSVKPIGKPDIELVLSAAHGGMMGRGPSAMRWTINGRSFPNTTRIDVRTGVPVTMRIFNEDRMSMMMGHRMDHPMHIHGTKFQVVSINGIPPDQPIWKDTIPVPAGGYVDLVFVMSNPGDWMLHCHIIDHEDGGMMTIVRAR